MITVADALGYGDINFYGVSYGSRLAQFVMRQFPDRVRSVTIDGVAPVDVDFFTGEADAGSRAFRQLFAACAADPGCSAGYPDLESDFFSLITRLNDAPVTLGQREDGSDVIMSGDKLVETLYLMLYQAPEDAQLPRIISAAAQNDFSAFEQMVTGANANASPVEGLAMKQAVYCAMSNYPQDVGFEMEAPFDGFEEELTAGGVEQFQCDIFDVEPLPDSVYEAVVSDIPTLVMNGQYDPILPLPYGQWVAKNLSNSYVYEYPGSGHGALFYTACPPSMARDFMIDPTQAPDDSCIAQMTTYFALPVTPIEELSLTQVSFDDLGFQTVAPEQWVELSDMSALLASNYNPDQSNNVAVHLLADANDSSFTTQIQLVKFPQMDIDTVIGLLIPESMETTRQEITVGDNEWTVLEAGTPSASSKVGLFSTDGDMFAIVTTAPIANADAAFDKLWQPQIENFQLTK